ncbi:MAG: SDR family oxidoreductase [Actinomycetota bacterium]
MRYTETMTDHTPQPNISPHDGRRVLVTGASSGIGRATAIALGTAGARVALAARSTDVLHEVAAEIGDDERVLIVPLDVTDMGQCRAAANAIAEAWGGLDAVINSAGLALTGGLLEMQPAEWATMFDVNVNGLLNITAAVAPMLQASELADIVNVSSMSGRRRASVSLGIYAATKHAVHVLSDNLREEFAGEVRVTTMSPGFVDTPIFEGATTEAGEQYRTSVREKGLDADVVAGHIVHALAQPAGVNLFEIALLSTSQ